MPMNAWVRYGRASCRIKPFWVMRDHIALAKGANFFGLNGFPERRLSRDSIRGCSTVEHVGVFNESANRQR